MIKTILWDFDGVILDSMKIKANGFSELFKTYDKDSLKKLESYHYENGGLSRFSKIKFFFDEIVHKNIDDNKIEILAKEFSKIIEEKLYNKNNLIQETLEFIETNYNKYNFHIVSGAEHNELVNLCQYFNIDKYFLTINGSPIKKSILIKNILINYSYNSKETILIGDSINDYKAALKNNIAFYGYNNINLQNYENYLYNFDGIKND